MKSKSLLFIGIFLLIVGILLRKLTSFEMLGLCILLVGVTCKTVYILGKIRSGAYRPGRELFFLLIGLLLFMMGLILRKFNQELIYPIYLIIFGLLLKAIYVVKFIRIIKTGKKELQ